MTLQFEILNNPKEKDMRIWRAVSRTRFVKSNTETFRSYTVVRPTRKQQLISFSICVLWITYYTQADTKTGCNAVQVWAC